ncbi:MAG: hypothetical protein EOP22_12440 [Hyphomicrobiales bacterium]|nr:MAG: hypothetical protein EOP22_12440 [Hyphomicrobiales bacterium]
MKSFSSTSFASDQTEALERALAAVNKHPQALFSDFQWFLYEGHDTVFYTAFSTQIFDRETLDNLVAEMVALAPQLTHGFYGARPGQPFPKQILDAITTLETVDSFEGYPDKWLGKSDDIFHRDDLPLFRVQVAVRRDGPDAEGRSSIIQVRSSHALLEGADSALLTRSQSAAHGVMSDKTNKIGLWPRIIGTINAWAMTLTYVGLGLALAPPEKIFGFKTLAISRHRLRLLANKLGVRQRSLYFALVTHALNGDGDKKHFDDRVVGAVYTMLDTNRNNADDSFFRVRAIQAKFKWSDDFVDYVRSIDDTVGTIERKDLTKFQVMMNTVFRTLRSLNSMASWLPGRRFWRFSAGIKITLTLVPPHRTYGPMTNGMVEPIYCGAWHDGMNICTFCPGREYVTLNFAMEEKLIPLVGKIETLLERIEAMDIAPTNRKVIDAE